MDRFFRNLNLAHTMWYPRFLLAIAVSLYAIFIIVSPDVSRYQPCVHFQHSLVLPPSYRFIAAAIFAFDAIGLWWRIFDPTPRVVCGTFFNILTAGLWLTVTVASIVLYGELWSDNVGKIMLTLTALYTLTRTDYTIADRGSA